MIALSTSGRTLFRFFFLLFLFYIFTLCYSYFIFCVFFLRACAASSLLVGPKVRGREALEEVREGSQEVRPAAESDCECECECECGAGAG